MKEKIYYFIKSSNPLREHWEPDMEGLCFIEGVGWMYVFFPTLWQAKRFIREHESAKLNLDIIKKKFSF